MSRQKKKFKKLSRELSYQKSELEYVREILKEAHWDFEEFYQQYCKDQEIDIASLNNKNSEKLKEIFPSPNEQPHDGDGNLITQDKVTMKDNTDLKQFKKIYREVAKILHPDKGGDEAEFKKLSETMEERDWSFLIEMCEKYNIQIEDHKVLNTIIQKKIDEVKQQINKEKSTYSWLLYECEDKETCKKNVVKKFLKHLFDYSDY